MFKKFALYPFAAKTSDFKVGQTVQLMITSHYGSSFVGTILALHPSIDKVDVQWPHQIGRHSPEDLLPVSDALGVRPTVVDLMVPSKDDPKVIGAVGGVPSAAQVGVVVSHLKKLASVMKEARLLKNEGDTELSTFTKVSSMFGDNLADEDIRLVVSSLFNRDVAFQNAVYLTVIHDLIDG